MYSEPLKLSKLMAGNSEFDICTLSPLIETDICVLPSPSPMNSTVYHTPACSWSPSVENYRRRNEGEGKGGRGRKEGERERAEGGQERGRGRMEGGLEL